MSSHLSSVDVLELDHEAFAQRLRERAAQARGVVCSEATLREYADAGLLSEAEVIALIQGLTPPLRGDWQAVTYLEDFEIEVARLRADTRAGRITLPCRPAELVDWAKGVGLDLPETFTSEVMRRTSALSNDEFDAPASSSKQRGKRDEKGVDPELQREAKELAHELQARNPRKKVLRKTVAAELAERHGKNPCQATT